MQEKAQNIWNAYKAWVLEAAGDEISVRDEGENIMLHTSYAVGRVDVHDLGIVIVELSVTNLADDENKFYLHFELKDLPHAQELFTEMRDTLLELRDKQKLKLLLCCTSGMTTGFFREKLNEAAELLSLDYEFDAVPFHKLYEAGFDYQVILLAPQISYHYQEACQIFQDRLVLKIPPKAFAGYDTAGVLRFVQEARENWHVTAEERAIAKALGEIQSDANILSVVVMPFANQSRIAYRIYEKGEPIHSETVIKGKLRVAEDLQDILDTVTCRWKKFDAVGIAVPGVPKHGHLELDVNMIDPELNLQKLLEDKYQVPIVITNNVNSAVMGFYVQQDKYQNILFLSHPRGYTIPGEAIVINGHLVQGAHNIAGEIKYLLYTAMPHNAWREHCVDHCADMEIINYYISMSIRAGISIVDPEVVVVRSEMIPDMEKLKQRLIDDYVREEYLPEFIHVCDKEMSEYAMLGQMILTLEALEK